MERAGGPTTPSLDPGWVVDYRAGATAPSDYAADSTTGPLAWRKQSSGTGQDLHGVAFIDVTQGWAVGDNGTILRTGDGGATWTPQPTGTTTNLAAVDFNDATHGWTVGSDDYWYQDYILATSDGGVNWGSQPSERVSLYGVAFTDRSHGWAVGWDGTILSTNSGGTSWSRQASGTSSCLYAVAFVDDSRGWAVGTDGVILSTSTGGTTWTAQDPGEAEVVLHAVSFVDASHGWIVGSSGVILCTTNGGASWTQQDSGTSESLYGVDFADASHGWAVGAYGTILKTVDGGASWIPEASGTTRSLRAITLVDAYNGWVVGSSGAILVRGDTTAPVTVASGADDLWHDTPVTIGFTASDNEGGKGVDYTEYRLDGGSWARGTTAVVAAPADHSGDGVHTLLYRSVDKAVPPNVEEPPGSVTVKVDTTPPGGTVALDNAAARTVSPLATIDSAVSDANGVEMRFLTDDEAGWSEWQAYAAQVAITLPAQNGKRTVRVQYRDPAGNLLELVDGIVLDMSPDSTAPVTLDDSDDSWHQKSVRIDFSGSDDQSGLAATYFQVDGGPWRMGSSLTLRTGKRDLNNGAHTINYYSTDYAGNVEATQSCHAYLDSLPPRTTNDATVTPYTAEGVITLKAADAGSGPAAINWCMDDGTWEEFSCQPGAEGSRQRLDVWAPGNGANDGIHTISYCAVDAVGNRESVHTIKVNVEAGTSVRSEESEAKLNLVGAWQGESGAGFSGGKQKVLDSGGEVFIGFDGSAIAVYASKGPAMGIASVWFDGEPAGEIDFYSSVAQPSQKVFEMTSLADGFPAWKHTLRLVWTGTKAVASTGTVIAVDAVEVKGSLVAAPNPLSVTTSTAPAAGVASRIAAATGGTLTTSGPDGTLYRLDIPAGVMMTDATVTMTPVATVGGLPMSGGLVGGVDLEPEGTTLILPATLTITPPSLDTGAYRLIGYRYQGAGQEFSLTDAAPEEGKVCLAITQFSGHGAGLAADADVLSMQTDHSPSDPGAAMDQVQVLHPDPVAEVSELRLRALRALDQVGYGNSSRTTEAAEFAREYFDGATRFGLDQGDTTVREQFHRVIDGAWNTAYFHCVAYHNINSFQDLVSMYKVYQKYGPKYCEDMNIDMASRWNDIVNCNYWKFEIGSRRAYSIMDGRPRGLLFKDSVTCSGQAELHEDDPEQTIEDDCFLDQGNESPSYQGKDYQGYEWNYYPNEDAPDIHTHLNFNSNLMSLPGKRPTLTITIDVPDHYDIMGEMRSIGEGHESHTWGAQDGWATFRYWLWCYRGGSYPNLPGGSSVLADGLEDGFMMSQIPEISIFDNYKIKEDFEDDGFPGVGASLDMTGRSSDPFSVFASDANEGPHTGAVTDYQFLDMESSIQYLERTFIKVEFTPHWVGPPPYVP